MNLIGLRGKTFGTTDQIQIALGCLEDNLYWHSENLVVQHMIRYFDKIENYKIPDFFTIPGNGMVGSDIDDGKIFKHALSKLDFQLF